MAVQYTDTFDFPLAPDTTENWGAIINGVLEDLDTLIGSSPHLLAREDDVDFNVAAVTNLFTVPAGFQCIVTKVILKPAAAGFTTLAANTDVDFGKVGASTDWHDAYDPSGLTTADIALQIEPDAIPALYDAAEVFAIDIIGTATAGALVDVLVFGILVVA